MRNKSQQAAAGTAVVVFLLLLVAMPLRFGQFHRLDRRSSSSLEVEEAHRHVELTPAIVTGVGCWAPRSDESTELQWTVCNDLVASEWQLHPSGVRIIQSEEDNGLEALGEGAHWKVYHGVIGQSLEPVAVKIYKWPIRDGTARDTDARIIRIHFAMQQRYQDPHILSLKGAWLQDDFAMLVHEYMEGGSLYQALMDGAFGNQEGWTRRKCKVVTRAAQAVQYLHGQDDLHGSVQAQKILLDKNGQAKLALSLLFHEYTDTVGEALHAYHYKPPEYFGQQSSDLCVGTDIWGLGVVMLELALAKPADRISDPPFKIRKLQRVPSLIAGKIEECLSIDPTQRGSLESIFTALSLYSNWVHRCLPRFLTNRDSYLLKFQRTTTKREADRAVLPWLLDAPDDPDDQEAAEPEAEGGGSCVWPEPDASDAESYPSAVFE